MRKYSLTILAIFLSSLIIIINSCDKKVPIKIGFVGGLTGRLSDLGTAGRNGVQLAVEKLNRSGGIKGSPIELIVKNDEQKAHIARQVDLELLDENVVAIIGHMTSSMSLVALPLINKNRMVMVSPTAAADKLTGIDDYFFALYPPSGIEIDHLSDIACNKLGLTETTVIYDESNKGYTEGWYHTFKEKFELCGGKIKGPITFVSGKYTSLFDISKKVMETEPKGLLIIAGALDTASICQQMQKREYRLPIISSGWALSKEFIEQGGTAVNGVIFSQIYDGQNQAKRFLEFKKNFRQHFGHEPDFGSALAYEATQIVADALSRVSATKNLKQAILEPHSYTGLQGEIMLGKYGDIDRQRFLITVKNRQFIVID